MSIATIISNAPYNNSDTLFRAWGSAMSAQLAAAGWIQTSDTGQINWVTVTNPGSSVVAGYEIWRMNDALQSSAPIFMKIEYATSAVANTPAIWVTLGSGSNGTGTLSGVLSLRTTVTPSANTTTAVNWYFSGDTDRFCFACVGAGSTTSFLFSVERTVNVSGVRSTEGALMVARTANGWAQCAWNAVTGPYTATWEILPGVLAPAVAPAGVFGSQVAVYPLFHNKGVFLPPGLNIMGFIDATMSQLSAVTFNVYGNPHQYIPLSQAGFAGFARGGLTGNMIAMIRWE